MEHHRKGKGRIITVDCILYPLMLIQYSGEDEDMAFGTIRSSKDL